MKRFMMVVALTCVLSSSALAGDVPSVGITATPPTGPTATASSPGDIPTLPGDIPTGGLTVTASDFLTVMQTLFGLM